LNRKIRAGQSPPRGCWMQDWTDTLRPWTSNPHRMSPRRAPPSSAARKYWRVPGRACARRRQSQPPAAGVVAMAASGRAGWPQPISGARKHGHCAPSRSA